MLLRYSKYNSRSDFDWSLTIHSIQFLLPSIYFNHKVHKLYLCIIIRCIKSTRIHTDFTDLILIIHKKLTETPESSKIRSAKWAAIIDIFHIRWQHFIYDDPSSLPPSIVFPPHQTNHSIARKACARFPLYACVSPQCCSTQPSCIDRCDFFWAAVSAGRAVAGRFGPDRPFGW